MILLISCLVTHKRLRTNNDDRFDRLEVFKYVLHSYARIKAWTKVMMYISLDEEFMARQNELHDLVLSLFSDYPITLEWARYDNIDQWRPWINEQISLHGREEPVFFAQNDDHVFIDYDDEIIKEGLVLFKNDPHPYKSLIFSHWPEVIRRSGKISPPTIMGRYVRFIDSFDDSIQILNLGFLEYLFCKLHCPDHARVFTRIDGRYNTLGFIGDRQAVYAPLRELCRKFNGYAHVGIDTGPSSPIPALVLPPENNKFDMTREGLLRKLLVPHWSNWTDNNSYVISNEVKQAMLRAHGI